MSELQDTINKIMSNPEAMRQVQSLGEKLGLGQSGSFAQPSQPVQPAPPAPPVQGGSEMMSALTRLAPLMNAAKPNDETAALLNALRPFLSGEKLERLNSAQRLIGFIHIIPLLKDSGLFF